MSNDFVGLRLNDRYEITKQLGAGGMGVVLQAHDHLLDRQVAVKIIQPGSVLAPKAIDAFIHEARIIARLEHPNILTVYDLGIHPLTDGDLLYLIMQLASGGTLAARLEKGPLSLSEVQRIMVAVCGALDYAHSQGVIHLDLKPLNILFDARNTPLVADFGLAKMLQNASNVKADTRVGTLAYMPPEQLFGAQAGPYSDVYALGITLYEMLTGEIPRREWNGAVSFDRTLPKGVLSAIEKATQSNPGNRYAESRALAQALNQAILPGSRTPTHVTQLPTTPARCILSAKDILPPPFEWIEIPSGNVIIEKRGASKVPAFAIAKYPVTNGQYAKFIEAGGYQDRQWWTTAGWKTRKQKGWTEPRYWGHEKFNGVEQPVVGVSWYEAVAFCQWLSNLSGEAITLPTEQQWQRAAQGDDGRPYPWGNHFDETRCNNSVDARKRDRTTPVCNYERLDDSPFGVVDMAGNVQEWCLTAYESDSALLDGTDSRIVRGGSWVMARPILFRAPSRFCGEPFFYSDALGFRCSCARIDNNTAVGSVFPRSERKLWLSNVGPSSFAEAEAKARELRRQVEMGSLTENEFQQQQRNLLIKSDDGLWWTIDAKLCWHYHDGSKWTPGRLSYQSVAQLDISESEKLIAELDHPNTSHLRRLEIGVSLAELQDPRPGVGLRSDGLPDIVWCHVPQGEVYISGKIFMVTSFYISKYPVTFEQFQAFLDDPDGWDRTEWWTDLAQKQKDKPEQEFKYANHPRENVSWYEAVAFCRWLNAKIPVEIRPATSLEAIPAAKQNESGTVAVIQDALRWNVRLPTEWEWQQAANCGKWDYEYPWGPEWDSTRCNTAESNLRRTTAVGMYPLGASPVGALDMSGNVWEWCLNEYVNPANITITGKERRVQRGSAWSMAWYTARASCYHRLFDAPDKRSKAVGFRVVFASSGVSATRYEAVT